MRISGIGEPCDLTDFLATVDCPHQHQAGGPHPSAYTADYDAEWATPLVTATSSGTGEDKSTPFATWPFPTLQLPAAAARLYEVTRSARVPNHVGPHQLIPTDLNIEEWRVSATGHEDDLWILEGVELGFPLQYTGPPRYEAIKQYNNSSAVAYADTIREYIAKETAMGDLYGPIQDPPFTPWTAVSPLMTREKPDSIERRVIIDLSYPDAGINACFNPIDPGDLPSNMRYFPRISQNSLKISPKFRATIHIQSLTSPLIYISQQNHFLCV